MGRQRANTTEITAKELAAVRAALQPTAEIMPVFTVQVPDTSGFVMDWFPPNELANSPAITTDSLTDRQHENTDNEVRLGFGIRKDADNTLTKDTTPDATIGTNNQDTGDKPAASNIFGRGENGRFQPKPQPTKPDDGLVQGLSAIPRKWPQLSDNSSLQNELGWVQSQRLSIVEERGNTTVVHLERASSPAPSKAALGWLETSIRSYAKYIDIVGRALSTQVDEQEHVRRERMRLDEITALLDEMQG